MKKTPLIILSVYMIAAFAGVTFAWMSPPKSPKGTDAVLEYGEGTENKMTIQSKDITFRAYAYDEELGDYVSTAELSSSFSIIPNQHVKLRFDFTNTTESVYKMKFQVANITTNTAPYSEEELPSLFQYIYFGFNYAEGYNSSYEYNDPVGTYCNFNDCEALYGSYLLNFLDDLEITPTDPEDEDHSKVSIYGYLLMSKDAGNEYIDKNLNIGTFRAIL